MCLKITRQFSTNTHNTLTVLSVWSAVVSLSDCEVCWGAPQSGWWTGCGSSLKPVNCEICAVARSHGGQGRELPPHARVFPRLCFPAAALISYNGVFSEIETGARGDSHRTSHQSPHVCVCVLHFWIEYAWTQFKHRFPYHSHNPISLIYKYSL